MFPDTEKGFIPSEIDLMDKANASLISQHLYRVQYLSKVEYGATCVRDFCFRHHLETNVAYPNELKGIAWMKIKSLAPLKNIVKVRINHIGQIVAIGEYD